MKTFITGIYGSGKTSLARQIAKENRELFISFDENIDYQNTEDQFNWLISSLPENFVMDAIPFDPNYSWEKFLKYSSKNECKIICCYCPDQNVWIKRVNKKIQENQPVSPPPKSLPTPLKERILRNLNPIQFIKSLIGFTLRLLRRFRLKILGFSRKLKKNLPWTKEPVQSFIPDRLSNEHYSAYRNFVLDKFPLLINLKNVSWFDSLSNEYTTYDEAIKRINPVLFELEERFFRKEYDVFYGDVDLLNLIGYSTSQSTWDTMKDITDWKDKTVLDIGCFHGYFSFKIEQAGAKKVYGLERENSVLQTARMITELTGSQCEFIQWVGGDDYPECDVILFLNVLHHFGDLDFQKSALEKIPGGTEIVFEIKKSQKEMVKSLFKITKRAQSHRENRVIFLATRK